MLFAWVWWGAPITGPSRAVVPRSRDGRLQSHPANNLALDPFAEADEDTGETKQTQNYIHIRIQRRCTTRDSSCLAGR